MEPAITVVGIGEDGWDGLTDAARAALAAADVVFGGTRQLDLVRGYVGATGTWPRDLAAGVRELATRTGRIAVLASGDPMFHGIGTTVLRELPDAAVTVLPHPSSVSLACARLGWPVEQTTVVSTVARSLDQVAGHLHPGVRLLVLTTDATDAADLAELVDSRGWDADLNVLERLGGPHERVTRSTAPHDRLAIVAIDNVRGGRPLSRVPGLPDDVFATDGVMTKREVRALTLSALAPLPGELLWDIGAGSGTVSIEWMRAGGRAVALEVRASRAAQIRVNAAWLGVPDLQVVEGEAPQALSRLAAPDAVFVGGGATTPGVLEAAVATGARVVANAVTLESEAVLTDWYAKLGGELVRIDVARAAPVGGFTAFRPALPVTQWSFRP